MIFGLFGRQKHQAQAQAEPEMPILVRKSIFQSSDDKKIVTALIDEYVNPLQQQGQFKDSELPPNAMRSYYTDFYMAQVANGGHGQFMYNSALQPHMMKNIREGLQAFGMEPFKSILNEFEAYITSDRVRDSETDEADQITGSPDDPFLTELDERFREGRCYETLMPANGRWLKGLPETKVVPDKKFAGVFESFMDNHPVAVERRRENLAQRMVDEHYLVAARLIGFSAGIIPQKTYSIPSMEPVGPNRENELCWNVVCDEEGAFVLVETDDGMALYEKLLSNGAKFPSIPVSAIVANYMSGENDDEEKLMNFMKVYAKPKIWKEIGRVSLSLIEEAKLAASNGDVFAAAEIACIVEDDTLTDVFVSQKFEPAPGLEPIWRTIVIGRKKLRCFEFVDEYVHVTAFADDGSEEPERYKFLVNEVYDYKAANPVRLD